MKTTEILEANGFKQGFPFVDHYRKEISVISSVLIHSCYQLKKNDVVEDSGIGNFCFKVVKINLPNKESKIFHSIENVINYINQK